MTEINMPKILIVDDETINIRVLEMILSTDYKTFVAKNGADAIKMIIELKPDLVLLDVMMPDLDGFEVCRIVKADTTCAHIPIIFVTALDKADDESKGLALGAADYISKPINTGIVKLRVKNHLALKLQRDLLEQQKDELEKTLGRIKRLEGIISICMYCKKIRNESELWQQMETYISEHSDAMFSHGVCPDCLDQFKKAMALEK